MINNVLNNFLGSVKRFRRHLLAVWICLSCAAALASENQAVQDTALYSAMSVGTAWALTPRHVVTNYHVVEGMHNLRLLTQSGKEIPVELLVKDKTNDLAILSITNQQFKIKPLVLALTRPRLGSQVFTIGYPHPNLMGTSPKLTSGSISAVTGLADDPRTYQISVPVQAGNSGGPLINMNGEVVGVITSKLSAEKMFEWTGDVPQNVNYAIKIKYLHALLGDIEMDETVSAGRIRKQQPLENLAETIIESVVIVAGDGHKDSAEKGGGFLARKSPDEVKPPRQSRTILVQAYAEPGIYDVDEEIPGSNTVKNYSLSTLTLLEEHLNRSSEDQTNKIIKVHEGDRHFYYELEKTVVRKNVCDQHKAEKIFASFSERNPGSQYRYVKFKIIDCQTLKEFRMKYKLVRNEQDDQFGYEMALHVSFQDFLLKLPPFINWSAN